MIDHRASPGITAEDLLTIPAQLRGQFEPAQGLVEMPILRCAHCGKMVMLNPERKRKRHYCGKCDHYVCDGPCAVTCTPFVRTVDESIEQSARLLNLQEV